MRVANYFSNNNIKIENRPLPKIGSGELLIRVQASGICGTDVLEWYRRGKTPLVLGHEIAGEIAEVGEDLGQYLKGQRVSASHHLPCGRCRFCLSGHQTTCDTLRRTHFEPGGFSQFLRLPAINVELGGVYSLPDNVSFEEATFVEPLACVLRAQRLSGMHSGKNVLILGCGISGILHIQLARLQGAALIVATDVVDYRLRLARRFGADLVIDAQTENLSDIFRKHNQGNLADLVIVSTGAKSAQLQAVQSVERGGCVFFFAATAEGVTIPVSINDLFWRNEVTLSSSYAATPQEHLQALKLISERKIRVKEMITHRFGLDKIQEGFRLVAEAKDSLKVIIEPNR
ncbi:MAG: alcohol dehydrogenase catalytic domain-containing protein [Candidatus Omnitrophica bacterium]|nr:alcohol dehydrogenase catalytic domain-containing protein [Candidatus Omnitrophota bacterium]